MSKRGLKVPSEANVSGEDWKRVERRFFWAYRGRVEARFHKRLNAGDRIIRSRRLLAGAATYVTDGRRVRARLGEWVFSPEGAFEHAFSSDAVVESVAFFVGWPTGERLFVQPGFVRARSAALNAAADALIEAGRPAESRLLEEWARLEEAFARWARVYVEMMREAGGTGRVRRVRNARVRLAMEEVRRWPAGVWLRSGEVAARAELSRGQLNRLFVRETGQSLDAYLKVCRLERARACLLEGRSAKETGAACGFATSQAFSKWFRRAGGQAPRAFARGEGG